MLTDRPTRRDEHQVKWLQAERELIIRGVIIPRSQSTLKSTAFTKGQPAQPLKVGFHGAPWSG